MGFYRLRGFGFVGTAIVGRIGFNEQWSYDDWLKSEWGIPGGAGGTQHVSYAPPSNDMLMAARDKWTTLEEGAALGLADYAAELDTATQRINDFVSRLDALTRSQTQVTGPMRALFYSMLNAELTRISRLSLADPTAALALQQAAADKKVADAAKADADRTAAQSAAVARAKQTADSIAAAQQAIIAAQHAKAVADAAAQAHAQAKAYAMEKSQQRQPLLIAAAVAIPVAIAAYAALRKKKK